eukprot:PITA_29326
MVCRDVNFNEDKAMRFSLEREIQLHVDEEILAPKEEPQDDVEQTHVEEQRVEETTHAETSRGGWKCTKEADILMHDARENVNSVWEVVPRPTDKLVVSSRWLYKVKQVAYGSVEKHKARFVAKVLSQVDGIDYEEIVSLVARCSSIIYILALLAQMGWKIHQTDVMTTFLNDMIREEKYI